MSLLLLASCGGTSTSQETVEIPTDVNPDVTALFVQACENKDSQCKQLLCSKEDGKFNCSENPLAENTNCSAEKSYDEIVTSYKMCWEDTSLHTYQIFNYSEKKNEFFTSMTPTELEAKITEEMAIIEEGGDSEWMWTFLASAGWALLGWIIANKMFGWASAQVPQRTNTENNRTVNKASFTETKDQSKTETQTRTEKRKAEFQKRVDAAKSKINSAKKTTTTKKSTSRRRR